MVIPLRSQADTEALGAALARAVRPGDAILLSGPLGAGKTSFARALLRALSGDEGLDVPSPSYTVIQTYEAAGMAIHHFDLWRLDGPDALSELGWDDATADVVLVEWPERLGACRPGDALELAFAVDEDGGRRVEISGWPDRWKPGAPIAPVSFDG